MTHDRSTKSLQQSPLDILKLFRVQEHRPFLSREVERTLQFLDVGENPESTLRIGMRKWIGFHWCAELHHASLASALMMRSRSLVWIGAYRAISTSRGTTVLMYPS